MRGNSSNYAEESQDRSILERSYDHSALLDETPPIPKDAKGVRDLLFGIHQAKMRARSRAHLNTSVTSIGELRYHLQGIRAQAEQALGDAQIRQTRRYDCYYDPPSLTLPERYKPKLSPPRQYRSISQDYQGFRAAPFYANQSLPNIGRNDASWAANGQPGYHVSGDNHSTVLESSNIMEDFNAPEDFSQTDLNYGPNVTILDSDDEAGLQVKLENLEDHNEIQRETNQSLEMFYTDEDYEDSEVEVDHKEEHPQTIEILSSESEENDSFVQNLESETDFESEDISSQDSGSAHSDDVSESQTPSSQRSQELYPTVNSSENSLNCSQVNSAVQEISNTSADAPLLYQEKPLLEEELVSKSSLEATVTETSYENPTSYICQDLPSHSPNKWSMMATTMPDSSCPVSYAADQLVIEHDQVSHSYFSVTDIPEAVTSQANPLDIGFENFNPDSQLLIPTIGSSHIILTEDGLTNHSSSSHSQFLNFENQVDSENSRLDGQLSSPNQDTSPNVSTEADSPCQVKSSHSNSLELEDQYTLKTSNLGNQYFGPTMDASPDIEAEEAEYDQSHIIPSGLLDYEAEWTDEASAQDSQGLYSSMGLLNARSGEAEFLQSYNYPDILSCQVQCAPEATTLDNQHLSSTMDASDNEAEKAEYDQSHIIPSGLLDYEAEWTDEASAQDSQSLYSSMSLLNARSGEAEFLQSHTSPSNVLSHQVQYAPEAITFDNQHLSPTMDASPDIEAEEAEYDQSHIIPSGLLDYEAEWTDEASAQDSQSLHPSMGFLNARSGEAKLLQSHTSPSDVLSHQVQCAPEAITFDNQHLSLTMDASPDIEAEEAEYDQSHIIPSGLLDYEAEWTDEASAQDSQSLHPSMGFLNARSGEAKLLQSHTSPSDVLSHQVQCAPEAITFDNQHLSLTMDASPDIEAEEAEYDQSHIIPSGLLDYEAEWTDEASAQDSQSLHPSMGFLNARSGEAKLLQSHTSPSDVLSHQVQCAPEAITFDNQHLSLTMDASPDIEAEEAEYDQSHIIPSGLLDYEAECTDEASAQDSQSLHPSMGFLNARSGEAKLLQSHTSPSDVLSHQVQCAPEAITFDNQHLSLTMDASPDIEAEEAEYDQSHIIPSGLLDYEAECTDEASAQDSQSLHPSMGFLNARSGEAKLLQSHTSPSDVLSHQVQCAPEAITFDNQHLSLTMDASPDIEAEEAEYDQSHIIPSDLLDYEAECTDEASAQDSQSLHPSMGFLNARSGEAKLLQSHTSPSDVLSHQVQCAPEAITFDNQHLSPTMDASPDIEAEEAENVQSHIIPSGLLGHDDLFASEVSAQDNQSLHTSMELLNVRSGEAEINSNIIFPTVVVTHENQSTSELSSSLTKENSGASIRLSISKEPSPGSSKHETISRKRHRESMDNSEFGSHSSSKLIFFPSEENGSRPSTPPGPDDVGSAQENLAPEKPSTLNLVSMEPVDDHILNSVYTTDEEYYDLDASYLTVSPSEYATPEDGGSPIKIKRRRLRRRGPQGYQLKIASSRELAGLGPLPREVVSPYPLRRVLPEGSSQKKRQFQSDSQGGPTNLTSLKRAKATPYILREKDGASYQNVNTSRSSLAPINPATTPRTPAKGNSARRFSKSPAPKR
ncbi:hypothetical protein DSO57_1012558 [Entomophthora muscae]|uniref:Uncharacterized protein n=1 Tax=Entomophthora muscae TaxID=34485 RepID=A0ACC2TGH3_9FUNG|nr:hypothetical protein DSO57_1012558 [Entomophthora muscae]